MWKVIEEIAGVRRISERHDGVRRVEVWSLGRTGRTMLGSNAVGHWKLRGYKIAGKFVSRLKGRV